MVIVPVQGDPLNAVTMIYAIRDAVKCHEKRSRARSLAITKLEEAAFWMREAAVEEGE
jgi:hypothetical protein